MVPMRRSDRVMEQENTLEVIINCQWAVLSMVNSKEEYPLGLGSPYAIPVSPVFLNGFIYFHCALRGHKIDNLKKDNRVCLSCVGQAENDEKAFSVAFTSSLVYARAFEVEDQMEKEKALLAICEKFAPSQKERMQSCIVDQMDHTAIWRLELLDMSGKQRKFESLPKV
ncbi:putative flavin-nucleotide-binding protein [Sphaerochaeta pleomorpha str. Grapes]|uniref:Putative flavin-nucleotide-binding protein n=1 Tax=Sphaerochaeta pleomorpha (strain ATCC BAA-1885 / DSM 22778 / Grapes) TaxID=158190 RepID=G8QXP0_SPHPG|nr:pyridoxamine 5'-phosphate oxidase family protein [Sphaerochaeta pleomorpha]AEV30684.1 putative flavin-nucleotide-binding protein [Sphaerochaeta pleomorpha str. Grapes]